MTKQEFLTKYHFNECNTHIFKDKYFYTFSVIHNEKKWLIDKNIHIMKRSGNITLGATHIAVHVAYTDYYVNFGDDNKVYTTKRGTFYGGDLNRMRKDLEKINGKTSTKIVYDFDPLTGTFKKMKFI